MKMVEKRLWTHGGLQRNSRGPGRRCVAFAAAVRWGFVGRQPSHGVPVSRFALHPARPHFHSAEAHELRSSSFPDPCLNVSPADPDVTGAGQGC